jgi:TnpA family transposase
MTFEPCLKSGFKTDTYLSDRYGSFHSKLIAATAREALHVLDGLLYHHSEVSPRKHHTDGGGVTEHVVALCASLGFQFAPHIPGLKHRRLYSVAKPSLYPTRGPLTDRRRSCRLLRGLVCGSPDRGEPRHAPA